MWAKISSALKQRQTNEDDHSNSQGEVLTKVFEQHPNLSVFHNSQHEQQPTSTPSPPGSPSLNRRKSMFKRSFRTNRDDEDVVRAPSPMLKAPQTLPRKMMSHFNLQINTSQSSLNRSGSIDTKGSIKTPSSTSSHRPVQEIFARSSADSSKKDLPSPVLSPRPATSDGLRNPSLTPGSDPRLGSVRSILRHPNTPGTGQNVRFFSREAHKTISPDTSSASAEPDYQPLPPMDFSKDGREGQDLLASFFGSGQDASGPARISTPAAAVVSRSASSSSSSRPSLSEVFSPLSDVGNASFDSSNSLDGFGEQLIPAPDFSASLFDTSEPSLSGHSDNAGDDFLTNGGDRALISPVPSSAPWHMTTSMPFDPQDDTVKSRQPVSVEAKELPVLLPTHLEEKILHSKDSPRLPNLLHDRSQSFSFGQTVFFSNKNNGSDKESSGLGRGSSLTAVNVDPPLRASSPRATTGRSRALSDTVFQRALSPTGQPPEADINDDSITELFAPPQVEPDPFSAHAKTYYTPQTMIPMASPPKYHIRTTSKEENIIFSLQTQLALQTELCGQYEADLRARDEMVEMLNNKLGEMEKEENRKKNVLRTWKKKVQEMEKAVRHLEEELEGSRHESMERSIMDEASGEALRMLHRQIASLERDKGGWMKKEMSMREEVDVLEGLIKERNNDLVHLKEALQIRDENEKSLQKSIREADGQIELMGHVSVGYADDDEIRRLAAEREQEAAKHRAAETNWQQEKAELSMSLESAEVDKGSLVEQVENLRGQMKAREEEHAILKGELEAQWQHTENASEKIKALEKDRMQLENEKVSLKHELTTLEEKTASLELEWQESENKRNELENELQEVWNDKELVERERDQLEAHLQEEREQIDGLTSALQEGQDRIAELEQEHRFAVDNVSRLEENLSRRDQELAEYSIRVVQREAEIEKLREELSGLRRGQSHEFDEKNRKVQQAVEEAAEARALLDESVRIKAELEVENKTNKDRVNGLKEEVDRLRRQVHSLQQDSADKEVRIVQITKQLAQKGEDNDGLNIALDSKQQELELMKRKQGVRGTAGSTPAQPSKTHHRRESWAIGTPVASRPTSAMSDSSGREAVLGKQHSAVTSSAIKVSALGKSTRVNGAMGPPASTKPRPSMSTPTPRLRQHSMVSQAPSGAKQPATTSLAQKRMSLGTLDRAQGRAKAAPVGPRGSSPNNNSVSSVSEVEEKENVNMGRKVPVPA